MLLKDALQKGIEILKNAKVEAPAGEAGVMLCSVIKQDKVFLYTHGDIDLDGESIGEYFRRIQLRANGMPAQYITGHQEFMSLDFVINSSVLIPRQDTEILVETVVEQVRRLIGSMDSNKIQILDIGTGSGCIAVSLAYYLEDVNVTAVDISQNALDVAHLNAERNGVASKVAFLRSNIFEKLEGMKFDVIVSNPPYIPTADVGELQREVKGYEPHTALDGGADGLNFYRDITAKAPEFLKKHGFLAFEVGYDQANAVAELMKNNYCNIRSIKDLAQVERVVTGQFINS